MDDRLGGRIMNKNIETMELLHSVQATLQQVMPIRRK
jgi:hypothetical protein